MLSTRWRCWSSWAQLKKQQHQQMFCWTEAQRKHDDEERCQLITWAAAAWVRLRGKVQNNTKCLGVACLLNWALGTRRTGWSLQNQDWHLVYLRAEGSEEEAETDSGFPVKLKLKPLLEVELFLFFLWPLFCRLFLWHSSPNFHFRWRAESLSEAASICRPRGAPATSLIFWWTLQRYRDFIFTSDRSLVFFTWRHLSTFSCQIIRKFSDSWLKMQQTVRGSWISIRTLTTFSPSSRTTVPEAISISITTPVSAPGSVVGGFRKTSSPLGWWCFYIFLLSHLMLQLFQMLDQEK